MKHKILNWLLPAVLGVLGSLDMYFGLVNALVKEMGLPHYYTIAFQIAALFFTTIIVKKQPPSINKDNT